MSFCVIFVGTVAERGGCEMFVIHGRKAALRPEPERGKFRRWITRACIS